MKREDWFLDIDVTPTASGSFKTMAEIIKTNSEFDELKDGDLVMFSAGKASYIKVRQALRALASLSGKNSGTLHDLGQFKQEIIAKEGKSSLQNLLEYLRKQGITAVVLCNETELILSACGALEGFRKKAEISLISADVNLAENSIIYKILNEKNHYLYQLNVLGIQQYLVDQTAIKQAEDIGLHILRLGLMRQDMLQAEPLLRNTDLALFHTGSIRFSDYQASGTALPNGLNGEEWCLLARYAGFSDRLSMLFAGPYHEPSDFAGNNAGLLAQMLWYFCEGWSSRQLDHPDLHSGFTHYKCAITDQRISLHFHKSQLSDRWWMEVQGYLEELTFVPCTYADYLCAAKGETPELFYRLLRKK